MQWAVRLVASGSFAPANPRRKRAVPEARWRAPRRALRSVLASTDDRGKEKAGERGLEALGSGGGGGSGGNRIDAELLATISLAAIAAAIGTTVVTGATLLVFSSVSGVASSVQSVESRLAVVEQGQRRFESATGAQLQQMEQGQRRFESATGAQLQQMEKGQLRFERATGAQLQQMEEGQRRFESATGAKLQQMEQDQQRFDSATEAKLQELEQNQRLIVVLILLSFVVALLMNLLG